MVGDSQKQAANSHRKGYRKQPLPLTSCSQTEHKINGNTIWQNALFLEKAVRAAQELRVISGGLTKCFWYLTFRVNLRLEPVIVSYEIHIDL